MFLLTRKSIIFVTQKFNFSTIKQIGCASVLLIRSQPQSPIIKLLEIICSIQLAKSCALKPRHY